MNRRVVLMGSRATIACTGFHLLRAMGIEVPLVISGDEDPGVDDWRLSLAAAARQAGYRDGVDLLVVRNPHTDDVLGRVRDAAPDMILSLQWRRIIRPALLRLAARGVVNLHNAPLPLLRGCDPFSWAIHDGLEMMGVTFHQVVDEGVDSGPILAQRLWPLSHSSTAWSVYQEALRDGEALMRESLSDIIDGRVTARAQEPRYASYHPMGQFRYQDLQARWDLPATTVSAALRARVFPPFQLPYFQLRGRKVEILECQVTGGRGKAGTVVSVDPLAVATSLGAIGIARLRVDGREYSDGEFVRAWNVGVGDAA